MRLRRGPTSQAAQASLTWLRREMHFMILRHRSFPILYEDMIFFICGARPSKARDCHLVMTMTSRAVVGVGVASGVSVTS